MGKPYIAGAASKEYYQLPQAQKLEVQRETNRRFQEQTGVTRQLDPTSASDLELRRTWLRIRDEVINERDEQQLRHELDLDGLTAIPEEMRFNGWDEGAQVLETWFERPPATEPNYSAPVTDLLKMSWILRFPRAKEVYDNIIKERIWTNDPSKSRMVTLLKGVPIPPEGLTMPFGNLNAPVPVVDQKWLNSRPVSNGLNIDALTAAVGAFNFNIAVAGKITSKPFMRGMTMRMVSVSIEEVGIYAKDSVDFEGQQFLGWWGYRDTDYYNSDFREWRIENHRGGDFLDYSDMRKIKLTTPDVINVLVP